MDIGRGNISTSYIPTWWLIVSNIENQSHWRDSLPPYLTSLLLQYFITLCACTAPVWLTWYCTDSVQYLAGDYSPCENLQTSGGDALNIIRPVWLYLSSSHSTPSYDAFLSPFSVSIDHCHWRNCALSGQLLKSHSLVTYGISIYTLNRRRSMPVPKRRQSKSFAPFKTLKSISSNLLNIDFLFQNTRLVLFYTFTPAVIVVGMLTEPTPASWLDIINILE